MLRVAFAGTFSATLEPAVRARLQTPCDVVLADETAIVPRLADADVLVTLVFNREMAAAATRLKLVQVPGAGLDRIDRAALRANTSLANVYGHEIGIAEYVIGAMLAMTRSFRRIDASLRRGVWESQWGMDGSPPPPWSELAGKTLGILGYGRIGQAVARRARAFEMQVCALRRDVASSAADGLALLGGPEALDEVLRRADYLAVTLSLNDQTPAAGSISAHCHS
jgi:phosphoglycerate dehydrogenase-like enzyme